MVEKVVGLKYKLDVSTDVNFKEYLVALGCGPKTIETVTAVVPTYELNVNGDDYTLKTLSDVKDLSITFKLGQEFDHTTADGRKVKTVFTRDGSKLIEVQTGDKVNTIVREFSTKEIKATMTVGGVTATRTYKV